MPACISPCNTVSDWLAGPIVQTIFVRRTLSTLQHLPPNARRRIVRSMPSTFVTLPEIRRVARKRLSRDVWNFGAGGSETETSMRRNRRALDRLAIRQDVLVDVREIDLT